MPASIIVVEDHPMFLEGLVSILSTDKSLSVVASAKDGHEAIALNEKHHPDILLMDISMPGLDGIEATKQIMATIPETKVLALSIHSGKRFVKGMLNAGAKGYLLKDAAPDELLTAIHRILDGDMYLSSSITSVALSNDEADDKIAGGGILVTKLFRPKLSSDCIARTAIIDELERNIHKPLSLISAGAGYGKSVTVSQWLERTKALFTWVSLDEEHNDLRTFLFYIHAAVEKIFPGATASTNVLLNAPLLPPINVIAHSLINELDAIHHEFILVLDDYHRINNKSIHSLIDELLRFPPENMHLCIITRKDPPLRINSFLLRNRMTEIRMSDLSFDETEIQALFLKLFDINLSEKSAKLILEKTEGWIVGLRMALSNIKSEENLEAAIENIHGDALSLFNFLLDEVLQNQPEEVQELLMITSQFDRFCADLIDEIYSEIRNDNIQLTGSKFLHWLIQSNLFVVSLDADRKWFRYHHLIQDLFRKRISKTNPNENLSIYHTRASKWFERNKYIEEAIHHMIAAGNQLEACSIVERHRWTELENDKWYVVQRWLNLLPEELVKTKPDLTLSEAWSAYENFQLEKIPPLVELTIPLLKDNKKDQVLLGECYLMLGLVYHWSGSAKLALEHFQKADELLPSTRKLATGMLYLHIGLSRSVNGEKDLALKELKMQLSEEQNDAIYITRLMAGVFYVNTFAGNLLMARKESQRIQKLAKKANLIYTHAMSICMEAISCYNTWELEDALNLFTIASHNRYNLHIGVALDALACKTIVNQLLQNPEDADKSLKILETFEGEYNHTGILPVSESCRAHLSLLRGDLDSALQWEKTVSSAPSFAGLFVWLEVPLITQARVLIRAGSNENLVKAQRILDDVRTVSETCHLINHTIELDVLQSILFEKQNQKQKSMEVLAKVVSLAEPGSCVRPFVEESSIVVDNLKQLQQEGGAVSFIDHILKCCESYENNRIVVDIKPEKEGIQPKEIEKAPADNMEAITQRELETIIHLSNGLRNKEIAEKLFVSTDTVKKHLYNSFQKLHVNNRLELVNKAKEMGLIEM